MNIVYIYSHAHLSRSNLLRLNILKVVQLTEKHINKITSVEEFFKRIYSVIHSNDPIARALTLRYYYTIISIISIYYY